MLRATVAQVGWSVLAVSGIHSPSSFVEKVRLEEKSGAYRFGAGWKVGADWRIIADTRRWAGPDRHP